MNKGLAVEGCTIEPQGIVVPGTGTLEISSSVSTKVKIQGKGVYFDGITFTITGANAAGYDPGTVQSTAPITIDPLLDKVQTIS